jgi:hypothetical protein
MISKRQTYGIILYLINGTSRLLPYLATAGTVYLGQIFSGGEQVTDRHLAMEAESGAKRVVHLLHPLCMVLKHTRHPWFNP